MNTNKPLNNVDINNAQNGTILHAKNRLLVDGFSVSENEAGFTLFDSKDSKIVGAINTKKGIV